jgi:hypothetical protein
MIDVNIYFYLLYFKLIIDIITIIYVYVIGNKNAEKVTNISLSDYKKIIH